jgi:hypothetical protein
MHTPDPRRQMLRHTLATLGYRAGKTIRGAPEEFAAFRASETTRTPLEILSHMGDLMAWALSLAQGKETWPDGPPRTWGVETERFFARLYELDAFLAGEELMHAPAEKLFQGPIADALTHTGQIALLRRMNQSPIRGENYFRAEIETGRTGSDQPDPVRKFD